MPRKIPSSKRNSRRNSVQAESSPPTISTGVSLRVSQWDEILNGPPSTSPDSRINFGLGMTAEDIERYEALLDRFGARTDRSLEIAQVAIVFLTTPVPYMSYFSSFHFKRFFSEFDRFKQRSSGNVIGNPYQNDDHIRSSRGNDAYVS